VYHPVVGSADDSEAARAARDERFARKRRHRARQQAARTPLARVHSADELRSLWRPENIPGEARATDEPVELWREVRTRLRALP
jgi:hypothetical protein